MSTAESMRDAKKTSDKDRCYKTQATLTTKDTQKLNIRSLHKREAEYQNRVSRGKSKLSSKSQCFIFLHLEQSVSYSITGILRNSQ